MFLSCICACDSIIKDVIIIVIVIVIVIVIIITHRQTHRQTVTQTDRDTDRQRQTETDTQTDQPSAPHCVLIQVQTLCESTRREICPSFIDHSSSCWPSSIEKSKPVSHLNPASIRNMMMHFKL